MDTQTIKLIRYELDHDRENFLDKIKQMVPGRSLGWIGYGKHFTFEELSKMVKILDSKLGRLFYE